jgi:hypothetical protein
MEQKKKAVQWDRFVKEARREGKFLREGEARCKGSDSRRDTRSREVE